MRPRTASAPVRLGSTVDQPGMDLAEILRHFCHAVVAELGDLQFLLGDGLAVLGDIGLRLGDLAVEPEDRALELQQARPGAAGVFSTSGATLSASLRTESLCSA